MALKNEGHTPKISQPTVALHNKIPNVLPHERVFPVQIGSELFKLSGASISSDSPSYFSRYFQCQIKQAEEMGEDISTAIRTLYIDRDPLTFGDIALHLQGYHVEPRDGTHFVRLFADAQFYSLPRLISQLFEESIFMSIGHREFQIPRDLFTAPGNSPNFFSLGFGMYFSEPGEVFPGLDRDALIRPPSILPPSVPGRSADTFAELLHLLRGYPVEIRSETHRATLLKDCRYFNFKGLEQRLVAHAAGYNQARRRDEIALRIEDILKSGISIAPEPTAADPAAAWVNYARPFVDDRPAELVLEIGSEATKLYLDYSGGGGTTTTIIGARAEFFRDARARVAKLLEVVATKLNLPPTTQPLGLLMAAGGAASGPATPGNTPLSGDLVRAVLEPATSVVLDGREWRPPPGSSESGAAVSAIALVGTGSSVVGGGGGGGGGSAGGDGEWADDDAQDSPMSGTAGFPHAPPRKRRRRADQANGGGNGGGGPGADEEWIVRTGQWRLRIQAASRGGGKAAVECVLVAVKLDALSSERARNVQREFLSR